MKYDELKNSTVSLVITSCKRHDLLFKTLASFVKFNTYRLSQIIIIEDSDMVINLNELYKYIDCSSKFYSKAEIIILNNDNNLGQMKSIDKAYSCVTSDFIFHCEDDWEFLKVGFIEESLKILNDDQKIFTVWLRGINDLAGHKLSKEVNSPINDIQYKKIIPYGVWSGFTLNPGLRRTKDCLLLHPYAEQKKLDSKLKNRKGVTESDLSIKYGQLGFFGVVTLCESGYIKHIGDGHHISNEWENLFVVKIKNIIKRIIR